MEYLHVSNCFLSMLALSQFLSLCFVVAPYLSQFPIVLHWLSLTVSLVPWSSFMSLTVFHGCWLSFTVSMVPWSCCMSLSVSYGCCIGCLSLSLWSNGVYTCLSHSLVWLLAVSHCLSCPIELLHVSHCLLWLLAVSNCLP